jgi:hypothetical protein
MTARQSRPDTNALTASSCPGRNDAYPKVSRAVRAILFVFELVPFFVLALFELEVLAVVPRFLFRIQQMDSSA